MTSEQTFERSAAAGWRTRDIVVAATIGVAFAVVFWFWNVAVWPSSAGVFAFFPPAQNIIYGVWLIPAILAPYIVRRPGAAFFAEMVAAVISALLGNQWGVDTLLSGFVQGAAAELVFAVTLYRAWSLPVLGGAALASAAAAWIHDWAVWYQAEPFAVMGWVLAFMAVSALVLAAGGSVLLANALRRAGVLEGFPA
ncbi:MAG TPA: ECF transporter S component [Candidatus Limnocylindrales bacterium]|nr:ECF transporter S component [Candidatus Limnocylindrales bacterium]